MQLFQIPANFLERISTTILSFMHSRLLVDARHRRQARTARCARMPALVETQHRQLWRRS